MKYETTDVVPMQRPTAIYTWAVVGANPPFLRCLPYLNPKPTHPTP